MEQNSESSNNSTNSNPKKQCQICLKETHLNDIWKCDCCDRKAHFICMFIDKLLVSEGSEKYWTNSLVFSMDISENLNLFKPKSSSPIVKELKSFANNRLFQRLSKYSKIKKNEVCQFVLDEWEILTQSSILKDEIKDKYGCFKGNSHIRTIIFCPDHDLPFCCFREKDEKEDEKDDFIACDYCGHLFKYFFYLLKNFRKLVP